MDFAELVRQRYSVRAYKPDPVEEDKLRTVLEAARLAPTAANRQAFQVIVVHTAGREEELRRVYARPWFVQAPLVLCACGIPAQNWVRSDGKNYNDVDVAIAMDHLILAAANQGLGTCWIAAFDPSAARQVLSLPEGVEPIAFTPLGYPADRLGDPADRLDDPADRLGHPADTLGHPADTLRPKQRKPLEELVRYERW